MQCKDAPELKVLCHGPALQGSIGAVSAVSWSCIAWWGFQDQSMLDLISVVSCQLSAKGCFKACCSIHTLQWRSGKSAER